MIKEVPFTTENNPEWYNNALLVYKLIKWTRTITEREPVLVSTERMAVIPSTNKTEHTTRLLSSYRQQYNLLFEQTVPQMTVIIYQSMQTREEGIGGHYNGCRLDIWWWKNQVLVRDSLQQWDSAHKEVWISTSPPIVNSFLRITFTHNKLSIW